MCGIGGVWVMGGKDLGRDDARKLRELAICLETRGEDAFGFYNGENVIKFPSSATDVISMIDRIKPFEELIVGKNMFLMHTRAFTEGNPLKNKNNHPFELKDIVFAHNGYMYIPYKYEDIRFKDDKKKNKCKIPVEYIDTYELFGKIIIDLPETDSFEIGVEIQKEYSKNRDFTEALSDAFNYLDCYGEMACWVYSKREDLLGLFRNIKPISIGFEEGVLWFASESWMLEDIGVSDVTTLKERELVVYSRNGKEYSEIIKSVERGWFYSLKELEREEREYWRYRGLYY